MPTKWTTTGNIELAQFEQFDGILRLTLRWQRPHNRTNESDIDPLHALNTLNIWRYLAINSTLKYHIASAKADFNHTHAQLIITIFEEQPILNKLKNEPIKQIGILGGGFPDADPEAEEYIINTDNAEISIIDGYQPIKILRKE